MMAPSEEIYGKSKQGTMLKTIRVYLHSFSSCCLPNPRNSAKFSENSNL